MKEWIREKILNTEKRTKLFILEIAMVLLVGLAIFFFIVLVI